MGAVGERQLACVGADRPVGYALVSGVSNPQVTMLARAMVHSLSSSSAKVWFDPPTDKRVAALDDGYVVSAIWDRSRCQPARVQAALADLSPQQIEASLAKGRTVPLPTLLDVKAAFVGNHLALEVPPSRHVPCRQRKT